MRLPLHQQRNADHHVDPKHVSDNIYNGSIVLYFHSIPPGELPPPAPKAFFGRDGLIEEIIGRVERLESFALVGAGGIGKTSIALTVLHDDRIKNRFEDNRRFISCDKFPPSRVHFLACISKVIGAGVENPEDLASLRHALSSKDMLLILDNAESILDPQGTDAREIYAMVKELSDFSNICLGVTSRISTVPPHCKRLEIPTLSMDAARDIFDSIYGDGGRSNIIDDLLCRLDFHALSVTLLATTASSNMWDHDRLIKEWDEHHAQVLRTDHDDGLAVTVELSLASPTFRKLGSIARDLLEVVAFFPQGVAEKNLEWFFPTIPDRKHIFDKFCVLSLAHRNGGFITMLAPIRDYLSPQDPKSSPHLGATKDWYFAQLSVDLHPGRPGFREAEWIKSEDVNVEHLLNVFASFDTGAFDVWNPCAQFMEHLYWHKPRHTVLKSKIEGLPDNHRSKSRCLFELSQLLGSVGNHAEQKRLLTHSLALEREARDNSRVAQILRSLSSSNLILGLHEEGMQQAREALEMYKQSGDTVGQAWCLYNIAWLFLQAGQPSAAENMALHAIDFLPEQGEEYLLCKSHRVLGVIYDSIATGGKGRAVDRFEAALGIASPFGWRSELFSVYYALANLSFAGAKFDDATSHITRAKSYAVDDAYDLGLAMEMQASIWYPQRRLEDARSEALRALEIYEKLGAEQDIGICRRLLQRIEQAMENKPSSSTLDMDREFPDRTAPFILVNSVLS